MGTQYVGRNKILVSKKKFGPYIVGLKSFPHKSLCQKNVGPTKIWFKNIKAPILVQKNWSKFAQ